MTISILSKTKLPMPDTISLEWEQDVNMPENRELLIGDTLYVIQDVKKNVGSIPFYSTKTQITAMKGDYL